MVGASLAGLCAAYSAARGGAETLLVEAAPGIGASPNPATILMEPIWDRTGLPIPRGAVERELRGLRVGGPSGHGPLFSFGVSHLDRREFDLSFARMAAGAGAGVRSGERVVRPLPGGGVYTDAGPIRARVTIFADGARSLVRGLLPTMRNPQDVAWGLDQLLEAPGIGEPACSEVRFGSFAPGWRAQFNPLGGDLASLWTFARGVPKAEAGAYAGRARRAFLGSAPVRVLRERGGVDPAFVVPGRLAGDGVMACGVAAGQGGLEYGARAGLLAGEVAARAVRAGDTSRRALLPYERAWRRETASELAVLRWGMGALRRLGDRELDALFEGLDGLVFGGEDLASLLRGNPRIALRKMGLWRAVGVALGLSRGWFRSAGVRR